MGVSPRTLITGVGLYAASATGFFLYVRSRKDAAGCHTCGATAAAGGAAATFDGIADSYDRRISLDETLMGVNLLRRWLMGKAEVRG